MATEASILENADNKFEFTFLGALFKIFGSIVQICYINRKLKYNEIKNTDVYQNLKSFSKFNLIYTFVVKFPNFCALNDSVFQLK